MNALTLIEQAELRARINLANRPRLGTGLERLNEVSGILATSKTDRSRFLSNPASYLNQQAITVSSCNLLKAGPASQQSPLSCIDMDVVVIVVIICVVMSNVDAVVVVKGAEAPQMASYATAPDALL